MHKCLFIVLAALLAGCGKPRQQLNVFIWPGYLDASLVADFEQQFNCKVVVDFYDDNESMIAKLSTGGAKLYDVIAPATYVIPGMAARGLLAPLRFENIPNFKNIDPQFSNTPFDPTNRYTVPLAWGTTGILIRRQPGRPVEETWSLFFDPSKQPGPFLLVEDSRAWIDAAMHFKGREPNSTDPAGLAEAGDLLVKVKKRSLGFATQSASISRVLAKEAVMTVAFSMDAVRAIKEDPELHYFLPREGAGRWMDNLAISGRAPHRALAEKFLNYMLDAKVAARFANHNAIGTPNKAALEFVNSASRNSSIIYPGPEVMSRLWYAKDLGEKNKLYDELWTQIKSK